MHAPHGELATRREQIAEPAEPLLGLLGDVPVIPRVDGERRVVHASQRLAVEELYLLQQRFPIDRRWRQRLGVSTEDGVTLVISHLIIRHTQNIEQQ